MSVTPTLHERAEASVSDARRISAGSYQQGRGIRGLDSRDSQNAQSDLGIPESPLPPVYSTSFAGVLKGTFPPPHFENTS